MPAKVRQVCAHRMRYCFNYCAFSYSLAWWDWAQWERMQGDNRPLTRSKAGPRRDFDYNLDGMAHFGMLPDFLQDLRNVGLTAEDLAPLFRSAYDYVEMWSACAQSSTST